MNKAFFIAAILGVLSKVNSAGKCGETICNAYYDSYCCGFNQEQCCYLFYNQYYWLVFSFSSSFFFLIICLIIMCVKKRQRRTVRMVSNVPFYSHISRTNSAYSADLPPPYRTVVNNSQILNPQNLVNYKN